LVIKHISLKDFTNVTSVCEGNPLFEAHKMVFETKTRATKRKTDNLNPGKGAKALKAKKEDAKVDDLTIQFKELKKQNELLLSENKKTESTTKTI
jgi:hypothetical protein